MIDEVLISRAIIERYFEKPVEYTEMDVAIAGAGLAAYPAKAGKKRDFVRRGMFDLRRVLCS